MSIFPNDADGQALESLKKQGLNLEIPQVVYIFVSAPDKDKALTIRDLLIDNNLDTQLIKDSSSGEYMCVASLKILLTYDEIVYIQEKIDELTAPYGGFSNGWGVGKQASL